MVEENRKAKVIEEQCFPHGTSANGQKMQALHDTIDVSSVEILHLRNLFLFAVLKALDILVKVSVAS